MLIPSVLRILKSAAPSPTCEIEHFKDDKSAQSGCSQIFMESPCLGHDRGFLHSYELISHRHTAAARAKLAWFARPARRNRLSNVRPAL
jgi:hypothetical protein